MCGQSHKNRALRATEKSGRFEPDFPGARSARKNTV